VLRRCVVLRAPDAPRRIARGRAVAGPPSERMSDLLSERGGSRRRSSARSTQRSAPSTSRVATCAALSIRPARMRVVMRLHRSRGLPA
jgi:hypothetical protein